MTDEALIERIARAVWNCNFHPDDVASGEADRRIADWPEDWAKSERQARAILPFIHAARIEGGKRVKEEAVSAISTGENEWEAETIEDLNVAEIVGGGE